MLGTNNVTRAIKKSKPEKEKTSNEQELVSKKVESKKNTDSFIALVKRKIPKLAGKFVALLKELTIKNLFKRKQL